MVKVDSKNIVSFYKLDRTLFDKKLSNADIIKQIISQAGGFKQETQLSVRQRNGFNISMFYLHKNISYSKWESFFTPPLAQVFRRMTWCRLVQPQLHWGFERPMMNDFAGGIFYAQVSSHTGEDMQPSLCALAYLCLTLRRSFFSRCRCSRALVVVACYSQSAIKN